MENEVASILTVIGPCAPPRPPPPPPARPPPPPPPPAGAGLAAAVFSASSVHVPAKLGFPCAKTLLLTRSTIAAALTMAVTRRISITPSQYRPGRLPSRKLTYSNLNASIGSSAAAFRAG